MTREKFHFFYEKESRFNPRLINKSSFLIGQVPNEKCGLKTPFFAIQHIEIENALLNCFPPPPVTKLIFVYSCSFTFHTSYKSGMIGHGGGGGGRCRNAQKLFIIKTY